MGATEAVQLNANNVVEKNALGIEYSSASVIGRRLKDAREDSSFSKEYIARKAKIRERYIDAIELGDWDVLPPGLNGRGLVRLYAKELGVPLPEFEGFNNLQTVQAEKQSENLSQNNFSKKSRYQPAAEESAEIIKIVPRSEYKNVSFEDHYNTSTLQNKLYQTKTHHTAAIVTPKISEIVGIDLAAFDINNESSLEHKLPIGSVVEKNDLNVLPLARPIHLRTRQQSQQQPESQQEEQESFTPSTPSVHSPSQAQSQEQGFASSTPLIQDAFTSSSQSLEQEHHVNVSENKETKNKFKLKKTLVFMLTPLIVAGVVFGLYRMNMQGHHFNQKPLPIEERKLIDISAKKHMEENNNVTVKKEVVVNSIVPQTTQSVVEPQMKAAAATIERSAKVDILARVKLQVEADGKEIFSGYHQPGALEFNFKDKAEILVYDASKVKLTYGSWDHGELGWNERKRKITLNARPYEE